MRAIICTDYSGHLRKLIWLTENETGISAGICERDTNPHATYHVDGTYHLKLTHRGRGVKTNTEKKMPLASITVKQPLLVTAAFYAHDTMNRLPLFKPDGRADTIVILGQSVFSGIRCAAFSTYILHRNHESAFLADAYSTYENGSFTLVAVNVFGLAFFPEHKVGMIVYKGRGEIGQQSLERAVETGAAPDRGGTSTLPDSTSHSPPLSPGRLRTPSRQARPGGFPAE